MTGLLCYLRDEQRQSSFKPVACELKIGPGEDAVRGQTYRLSDGRTVQLIGTVDRADESIEDDGTRWVRVVDYKTGTKSSTCGKSTAASTVRCCSTCSA